MTKFTLQRTRHEQESELTGKKCGHAVLSLTGLPCKFVKAVKLWQSEKFVNPM
jgi:hypothetical protein